MIEIGIAAWVVLVGVMFLLSTVRQLPLGGLVSMAPLVGTGLYILSGLVLVTFGAYSTARSMILVSSLVGLRVVARLAMGEGPTSREWFSVLGIVAAATLFGFISNLLFGRLVRLSPDSLQYLLASGTIESTGTIDGIPVASVQKRLLVVPLLHTGGAIRDQGFIAFWTPMITVSVVALTSWISWVGLQRFDVPRKWRWAIVGATIGFMVTTNGFLFHSFYLNGHMVFAAMLLLGVGAAWYAATSLRWEMMLVSAVGFASLVPMRAESLIVAVIFAVPIVTAAAVPLVWKWKFVAPMTLATLLWNVFLLPQYVDETELGLSGSVYGGAVLVAGLLVLVLLNHWRRLAPLVSLVPWMMSGAVFLILGALAWRDFGLFTASIASMAANMAQAGLWSMFWFIVPALFLGSLLVVSVPHQRFWSFGVPNFAMAVLVFAFLRGGAYRVSWADSGNRMMMHVVPLLVLAVTLGIGLALSEMPRYVGDGDTDRHVDSAV